MGEKFDEFKAALQLLCVEHGVSLSVDVDGIVMVDDLTPGDDPLPELEDYTFLPRWVSIGEAFPPINERVRVKIEGADLIHSPFASWNGEEWYGFVIIGTWSEPIKVIKWFKEKA